MIEVSYYAGVKWWCVCCSKSHGFKCPLSMIRAKKGDIFYVQFSYWYLGISLIGFNGSNPHCIQANNINCNSAIISCNKVLGGGFNSV